MPLNTFTRGLSISDLPEFCGPDDLSDAIISIRQSKLDRHGGDARCLAPISDDGIRRLIQVAYFTSLAQEEGRYPQFRCVNVDAGKPPIRLAASCTVPITDVESLRRLAPAASETDGALLVTERGGSLVCMGFMIVNDMGFAANIGRPEIVSVGLSPSLIVRVDGPGRLRASESGHTLILARGGMWEVVDYRVVPAVRKLWDDLAARMVDKMAEAYGEESRAYFGGYHGLAELIHKVWSRVLAGAIDRLHGGALVILPSEGSLEGFDIHCKYPVEMRLGDDILEFWKSCVHHAEARNDDQHERDAATQAWSWRRAALFTKAEILAGLSSVDGCVVLDRNLQVLGFGGEIRVDDQKVYAAPRALRNLRTGQLTPEAELEQYGTRHRSAYRLAKVSPGTIVFVISQDGDLRIFCSDEETVFGFDRLHAWVHQYEAQ
jgi:hypothetical protein